MAKKNSTPKKKTPLGSEWVALEADDDFTEDVPSGDEDQEDELPDEGEDVESDIEKINSRYDRFSEIF